MEALSPPEAPEAKIARLEAELAALRTARIESAIATLVQGHRLTPQEAPKAIARATATSTGRCAQARRARRRASASSGRRRLLRPRLRSHTAWSLVKCSQKPGGGQSQRKCKNQWLVRIDAGIGVSAFACLHSTFGRLTFSRILYDSAAFLP